MILPVLTIVVFIICYSIFHALAKLLGGKGTGSEYFRALAGAYSVISFIELPVITFIHFGVLLGGLVALLFGIWFLCVNTFALRKVHDLTLAKSIILGIVLPVVIVTLFLFFLFLNIMGVPKSLY